MPGYVRIGFGLVGLCAFTIILGGNEARRVATSPPEHEGPAPSRYVVVVASFDDLLSCADVLSWLRREQTAGSDIQIRLVLLGMTDLDAAERVVARARVSAEILRFPAILSPFLPKGIGVYSPEGESIYSASINGLGNGGLSTNPLR